YRPIVVNKGTHTGRENEILAGNHTWQAARDEGWPKIAATFVDVDEETAAKIVAVDNRASDRAKNDDDVLAELLGSLEDLEGSGYSEKDLEKLLGKTAVDEDDEDAFATRFELVVECRDEAHQREMYEKLDAE